MVLNQNMIEDVIIEKFSFFTIPWKSPSFWNMYSLNIWTLFPKLMNFLENMSLKSFILYLFVL